MQKDPKCLEKRYLYKYLYVYIYIPKDGFLIHSDPKIDYVFHKASFPF